MTSLEFSPDGASLHLNQKEIGPTTVDFGQGGELRTGWPANLDQCSILAVDPTGRSLALARDSGTIEIRDPKSLNLIQRLPGHDSRILSMSISRDGRKLISVDLDGNCKAWSLAEGRIEWEYTSNAALARCALSPDGKQVALGYHYGRIAVLDASNGSELAHWESGGRTALSLAFTPDSQSLASIGLDGRLRTWDALEGWSPGLEILLPGGSSGSLAIAPDGLSLATGHNDGCVRFWDLASGKLVSATEVDSLQLSSISFDPAGRRLAVAVGSKVVVIETPGTV